LIYLLDTDHISLMMRMGPEADRIRGRLLHTRPEDVRLSVISYEEQVRGRLARVARARSLGEQREQYGLLSGMLELYCSVELLPFDEGAVDAFRQLWLQRPRVGTMDLRIAAIALANDATLVTRNLRDFERIPALRIEDWTI
jgi:tRNA(fMet)-specific endonuclease VapC